MTSRRRSMAVTAELIRETRRYLDQHGESDTAHLRELHTHAEVIAYMATVARDQGHDEADAAEIYARVLRLDRETIREAQQLLGKLGYRAVSDRLREVARRAKPAPL